MATKQKGLGRGLDALLSGDAPEARGERTQTLTLDQLQPGKYQPRTHMDQASLNELADSIKAQGIIQPILVRQVGGGKYEIVAGERRVRAARIAGLNEVPVVVREIADHAAAAIALIENIQREDLNPLEEAQGLSRLIAEFKLTQEEAAQAVGRSRSACANLLRLLHLPRPVQDMLHAGELDMGHARALLGLPAEEQIQLAFTIKKDELSVREVEALVRRATDTHLNPAFNPKTKPKRPRDLERLEQDLSEKLGTKVEVVPGKKGGKLVIHYASNDHLQDLLERVK